MHVPTRDVDLLAPDDDNLLAVEDELGDDGGQTAHHVASAVNNNGLGGEARHSSERQQNDYDMLMKAMKYTFVIQCLFRAEPLILGKIFSSNQK